MRILFLTQICPYPPSNGSAIKTYNILKHLGARHEVRLLLFVRTEGEVAALRNIELSCRDIDHCIIRRSAKSDLAYAARSLLSERSFIISRDWRAEMQAKVLDRLNEPTDLLYVDHLQMAQYVPSGIACPVLLDEHNVEWRIVERFARTGASLARRLFASVEWRRLRSHELQACARADLVLTVTAHDRDILVEHGIASGKVVPLPVGVDTELLRPVRAASGSGRILFFGSMAWPPNADAVSYFIQRIYPMVKAAVPEARFTVVGANPPSEITRLAARDASISVTGYVDDIRPYAESAAVFVVPLRVGSGMRVKILDAMALGLPVVTTSVGCEGIHLQHGEHALVADSPEEFAQAVTQLLRDSVTRRDMASAGRRFVEQFYAWPPIMARLDEAIESLRETRVAADGLHT
jgi:sugar transferase (PEP-CTERM/EpsH1 system associated)